MTIASYSMPYDAGLAADAADILAAQRLRYSIFASELGGDGVGFDHQNQVECDSYDAQADHLILKDNTRPAGDQIIAVTRLIKGATADAFYSSAEFDLGPLLSSGQTILEMSRTCVHPDYRGGTALLHLWQALAAYVTDHAIDVIFGVASFPGAAPNDHRQALGLLHQYHLAPAALCPKVIGEGAVSSTTYAGDSVDRRAAMIAMPALIKAYLRMGGVVGDGAFVDTSFGTTDVCMILETTQLTARQRAFLGAMPDG